jgi:hypothetical protein
MLLHVAHTIYSHFCSALTSACFSLSPEQQPILSVCIRGQPESVEENVLILHPGSRRLMRLERKSMLVLVSVSHGPADGERPRGDSIASNEPRGLPLLHLRVEERCRTVLQALSRQRGASFFLEFPAAVKELRKPIWSKVTVRGRKAGVEC